MGKKKSKKVADKKADTRINRETGTHGRVRYRNGDNGQFTSFQKVAREKIAQLQDPKIDTPTLSTTVELFSGELGTFHEIAPIMNINGVDIKPLIIKPLSGNYRGEWDFKEKEFSADINVLSAARIKHVAGEISSDQFALLLHAMGFKSASKQDFGSADYFVELASASAEGIGKFSVNKQGINATVTGEIGVMGPNGKVSYKPAYSISCFGFNFELKEVSLGGGVGAKAKLGAGFDVSNYRIQFHLIVGAFSGIGLEGDFTGGPGFDRDLFKRVSERSEAIASNNSLYDKEDILKFRELIAEVSARKVDHSHWLTGAWGEYWKWAQVSSWQEVIDETGYATAYAAIASEALIPRLKKIDESKKSPEAYTPMPSYTMTEVWNALYDGAKSQAENYVLPRDNYAEAHHDFEQPTPELPSVPSEASVNVPLPMKALLGLSRKEGNSLTVISQPFTYHIDFFKNKIKQDAERAKLLAPPSVPQRSDTGFMNGISFKKDERGQDGLHYRWNHQDSDNPHGMDLEVGISFRAAFEIFKLANAAWSRARHYSQKQKDAYNLIKFMGKGDGTESHHLEFEQRLQRAQLNEAEKKHFKLVFLTGNSEELIKLKEMILDKNHETHAAIRRELQALSSTLDSRARENQDFFERFKKDNNEDNLSLYSDILYATLRPTTEDITKQGIYQAIGNILYAPELAKKGIHDLCKDQREADFKRSVEPKIKKLLENYTNAKSGKKSKQADNFDNFVKKNEDIYHDEMADYQLQFHRKRGTEFDLLKTREILKVLGKIPEANAITHDLARKFPSNKAYAEQSGDTYAKQGDFTKAALQWQRLDALSAESANLLYHHIKKLEKEEKFPEAKDLCEKFFLSSKVSDENFYYVHWYVSLCFDSSDYPEGISQLEKLMTEYGDDKVKYESTATILLNAYGVQAQNNGIPLHELKTEWLAKILNDQYFSNIDTILGVLNFCSSQGDSNKFKERFNHYQEIINACPDKIKTKEAYRYNYLAQINILSKECDFTEAEKLRNLAAQENSLTEKDNETILTKFLYDYLQLEKPDEKVSNAIDSIVTKEIDKIHTDNIVLIINMMTYYCQSKKQFEKAKECYLKYSGELHSERNIAQQSQIQHVLKNYIILAIHNTKPHELPDVDDLEKNLAYGLEFPAIKDLCKKVKLLYTEANSGKVMEDTAGLFLNICRQVEDDFERNVLLGLASVSKILTTVFSTHANFEKSILFHAESICDQLKDQTLPEAERKKLEKKLSDIKNIFYSACFYHAASSIIDTTKSYFKPPKKRKDGTIEYEDSITETALDGCSLAMESAGTALETLSLSAWGGWDGARIGFQFVKIGLSATEFIDRLSGHLYGQGNGFGLREHPIVKTYLPEGIRLGNGAWSIANEWSTDALLLNTALQIVSMASPYIIPKDSYLNQYIKQYTGIDIESSLYPSNDSLIKQGELQPVDELLTVVACMDGVKRAADMVGIAPVAKVMTATVSATASAIMSLLPAAAPVASTAVVGAGLAIGEAVIAEAVISGVFPHIRGKSAMSFFKAKFPFVVRKISYSTIQWL